MKTLALADDATGALETGARMRAAGLDARVVFDRGLPWTAGAVVVDTETRHLPAAEAGAAIAQLAARARRARAAHIFKKTDSTLRGPIAAEFRALLGVWGELPLVYAPAYPALGRTVRGGELLVEGRPLRETAFASDPLNPAGESSITARLRDSGTRIVVVRGGAELSRKLAGGSIFVCDGETESDLAEVAAAVRGRPCIMAGTAAMASVWAAELAGPAGTPAGVWTPPRAARRGMVINGSLHPASREQVEASGIGMVAHDPGADPLELAARLAELVAGERWGALCASPPRAADSLAVARHLARVAALAVRGAAPDCLVVFGGDTVFAILREFGVAEAEPHAELLPGAPASSIVLPGTGRALLLVSKAGGFGMPGYLARIREILEKR